MCVQVGLCDHALFVSLQVYLWHRGCGLQPECISSKEIGFVCWEFYLLIKDISRCPGSGGGCCSTRGGSSGNTNGRAANKHDSLHGFLPSGSLFIKTRFNLDCYVANLTFDPFVGYHSSIGTRHELATLLPSSNVSAAGNLFTDSILSIFYEIIPNDFCSYN